MFTVIYKIIIPHLLAVLLLVCTSLFYSATAQIAVKYKDRISEEKLDELLEKEEGLLRIQNVDRAKEYENLGVGCINTYSPLAREYLDEAQSLQLTLGDSASYYGVEYFQAKTYINDGRYKKADSILQTCLTYFSGSEKYYYLAKTHQYIGDSKYRQGELDVSLRNMYKSKEYFELHGGKYAGGPAIVWIALINDYMQDYKANLELLPYIEDFRDGKHENGDAYTLMMTMSMTYRALDSLQQAEDLIEEVFPYFEKRDNPRSWNQYYAQRYKIALEKEQYVEANEYADQMIAYSELLQSESYLASAYINKYYVVDICCPEEDRKSYLELGLDHALKSEKPVMLKNAYNYYFEEAIKEEDYKEAILYKQKIDSLEAILFTKGMAAEIKRIEKEKLKEQSDKEVALLKEKGRLKQENLDKQKKIKYGLLIFLGIMALCLGLIALLLKRRTEDARQLADKNETINKALDTNKMLMKEVHHRVKNNLQVVSSLLNLQSRYMDDDLAKQALSTGRARVQSMSLLHQSLYQKDNIKLVDVKSYFGNLCENLFSTYKVGDKNIEMIKDIDEMDLDVDTVIPMGLITNELISNALKYAFEGTESGSITLRLKDNDSHLVLQVADDGGGIPFTEIPDKTESLGLKLIKSFSEKLEAEVIIENTNGTSFRIIIDKAKIEKQSEV